MVNRYESKRVIFDVQDLLNDQITYMVVRIHYFKFKYDNILDSRMISINAIHNRIPDKDPDKSKFDYINKFPLNRW